MFNHFYYYNNIWSYYLWSPSIASFAVAVWWNFNPLSFGGWYDRAKWAPTFLCWVYGVVGQGDLTAVSLHTVEYNTTSLSLYIRTF